MVLAAEIRLRCLKIAESIEKPRFEEFAGPVRLNANRAPFSDGTTLIGNLGGVGVFSFSPLGSEHRSTGASPDVTGDDRFHFQ